MKITSVKILNEVCEGASELIVYGAGRVCYALLQYLAKQGDLLDKVFCIMVSGKAGNSDNVLGIPVCLKQEVGCRENATVIVATFENAHEAICEDLSPIGYREIKTIGNILYAELRKYSCNLETDIMQNTQWIRNDLQKTLARMDALNSRLARMEVCMQNGVRYFDELLVPSQYEDALKNWYYTSNGKPLNLDSPETYNEKIQWIKLHGVTPLMARLSDKYEVREWVKEKIGEEHLIPLLGVWDSFDDIDIESLPERFVLKCNHGSSWNMVVKDKKAWNVREAKKKFDRWMDTNFAFVAGLELQYKDIVPKIIAEEYLENKEGDLFDYKFWCFDGKVEFVMFLSERAQGLRMNNYDKDWNLLPFTYDHPNSTKEIPKPEKLAEMIAIAEKLGAGFPHVRVDLYQLNDGTIKFGEMTFTSDSGKCKWSSEEINRKLGDLIKL